MQRWFILLVVAVTWTVPAGSGEYKPTFGDMMNAIVQPRHIKLGLAGQAGNWPLAAHELHELDEAFVGSRYWMPILENTITSLLILEIMNSKGGAPSEITSHLYLDSTIGEEETNGEKNTRR